MKRPGDWNDRTAMNMDLVIVLFLLTSTVVMFALNRPRMDAVALIMMTLLPLTGVITMSDALAGLSDPNIVLIAALFVIGEGLVRTGVARKLGDALVRGAGKSEKRLVALLMIVVAGIGSVMSSTGVVAIFIPAALRIARNLDVPAGRLMMPLSVAALISGMMTLIATAPNLVVHSQLVRAGYEGFKFFSFATFGVPVIVVAIGYMTVTRNWLSRDSSTGSHFSGVKQPRLAQWIDEYGLLDREYRFYTTPGSPFVGKRLSELRLRSTFGMNVLAIERQRRFAPLILEPSAQTILEPEDVLFVDFRQPITHFDELSQKYGLRMLPMADDHFSDTSQTVGMAELMIPAESNLIGKTPVTARFRSMYQLSIIGIKRGKSPVTYNIQDELLHLGDTLLVAGPWKAITRLRTDPNELIVLNVPVELDDVVALPSRAPLAVGSLVVVIGLMVTGIVPNVQAALVGCLLLGIFRCVDINSVYRSIQWPTLFLIVGMLPFSIALQNTGGVDLAVGALLNAVGDANPMIILTVLYTVTAFLGLFISNTATAVPMAPIAIALATELSLSPYAFGMTVALASSAAFMTPVSSPVNALVVGPGNYRFVDFVRIGVPLYFAVMTISMVLIGWVYF